MKQLEPRNYGLQLRRLVDENTEYCAPEPYEYIVDQESVILFRYSSLTSVATVELSPMNMCDLDLK